MFEAVTDSTPRREELAMLKSVVTFVSAAAILLAAAATAHAQPSTPKKPGFELLLPSGTVVPTGAQQSELKRASLTAVQLSYGLRPDLVLTGTVGWARTRPLGRGDDARLNLFTYDIGAECRLPRRDSDAGVNFKPFTGAGVGARTFDYRHADAPTTHNLAAYASAGGELGLARVRVRLEVRDYMTWLDAPGSSDSARRNDVVVMAGLRLGVR
jgi:hypothetical protein